MFIPLLLAALATAPAPAAKPATNTLCPVMGGKVNAKSPLVVVNGRAYRMCCGGCDKTLKADPALDGILVSWCILGAGRHAGTRCARTQNVMAT